MSVCLSDLKIGDKAKILGFNPGNLGYQQRLLAMGLVPGSEFIVIRMAPLGDPIEIRTQNISLCIRKAEGSILQIELQKQGPEPQPPQFQKHTPEDETIK